MFSYDHLTIPEATNLQQEMGEKVVLKPLEKPIRTVAGADISYNKYCTTVYAGIVVMNYPDLKPLAYSLVETAIDFPYVPGYLAFREVPAVKLAWGQLPEKPDVTIMDGQGIVHPRKMGIASHFGLLENVPAIGCAKNMLFGKFENLGIEKFSTSPIIARGETLGYALRTQNKIKPVYISPGHLITLDESLEVMKNCTGKYRIPEPTRLAHIKVNEFRLGEVRAGFHLADDGQTSLW